MTQDDIIKMARECGGVESLGGPHFSWQQLERFARLVAIHEQEACAKVCDDLDEKNWSEYGRHKTGYSEQIRARGNNG